MKPAKDLERHRDRLWRMEESRFHRRNKQRLNRWKDGWILDGDNWIARILTQANKEYEKVFPWDCDCGERMQFRLYKVVAITEHVGKTIVVPTRTDISDAINSVVKHSGCMDDLLHPTETVNELLYDLHCLPALAINA